MSSTSSSVDGLSKEEIMPDMPTALAKQPHGAEHIAPDAHGRNFYTIDRQFQDLLSLYLEPGLRAAMTPHFERLGALAGNRLDDLAMVADKHPPVLQPRDRFGRDEDWIDYHPAYREMETIAFEDFGMHAMTHRAGVLGMAEPAHPLVKYGITYLFVQAEFGLMCPVSVSDTSNFIIKRFGSPALRKLLLDRLLSQDPATMLKGTQFMTEKAGGSDVGALPSASVSAPTAWSAGSSMARNGSAAMPMPTLRCCWHGRAAPRPARGASACSPCRGGWRTAAATATGSCD
jgi:acyl-CoA dehydrogenase